MFCVFVVFIKTRNNEQLVHSIPDSSNNDLLLAESGMGASSSSSTSVEDEATLRHDIQRTLNRQLLCLSNTQLYKKSKSDLKKELQI